MSLSDLAAIGSFASGIAVVLSFIFLALQMRQANQNQKSLMQQGRTARTVDILMKMTEPVLSETIMNAVREDASKEPGKDLCVLRIRVRLLLELRGLIPSVPGKNAGRAKLGNGRSDSHGASEEPCLSCGMEDGARGNERRLPQLH
jgi:hypothetical protein